MHIRHVQKYFSSVVLASLLLPLFTSPILAAPTLQSEQRVTDTPSIYYSISFLSMPQFPSYSDGRVVWKDDRNENSDIYMYDFNTDTETQITTDGNHQVWPSISGNNIVWMDDRNGSWDIYLYDLVSETETRVTSHEGNEVQPCISGDIIVWGYDPSTEPNNIFGNTSLSGTRELYEDGSSDIYMYDIETDTESALIDMTGDQYSPWIDGNIVVWEDNRGPLSQIYSIDLADPVEDGEILSPSSGDQYWPSVTGTKVTWTEDRDEGSSFDVYVYDLSGLAETQITDDENIQAFGHISGNYIVWTDNREGTWDVFIANLTTGVEYPLVVRDAPQGVARIYGNRVIWGDSRDGLTEPDTFFRESFLQQEYSFADIYSGIFVDDTTPPTFDDLPDQERPLDFDDGGTITTTPFTIRVKPADTQTPIVSVVFKVDGRTVCTDTTPGIQNLYECVWAVPDYCPASGTTMTIRIEATDSQGNTGVLTRTVTPSTILCPRLADTGNGIALGFIVATGLAATVTVSPMVSACRKRIRPMSHGKQG